MNSPPHDENALTLDAIDSGLALVEGKRIPDQQDVLEKHQLDAAKLKNRLARSHIKNVAADRRMRKTYASQILNYLRWYSGFVGFLALLCGWKPFGFSLPESVMATLVGSTAIAAIGLVGFIARGLFKAPSIPTE